MWQVPHLGTLKKKKETYFLPDKKAREVYHSATPHCLQGPMSSLSHHTAMFGHWVFILSSSLQLLMTMQVTHIQAGGGEEVGARCLGPFYYQKERFPRNDLHKSPQMPVWSHSSLMRPALHPLQAGWETLLGQLTKVCPVLRTAGL